jgi:hypothetical protein
MAEDWKPGSNVLRFLHNYAADRRYCVEIHSYRATDGAPLGAGITHGAASATIIGLS